jgi:hypothetical protein
VQLHAQPSLMHMAFFTLLLLMSLVPLPTLLVLLLLLLVLLWLLLLVVVLVQGYDVAVARAVADMRLLAEFCLPFVRPGGVWVAAKGANPEVGFKPTADVCGLARLPMYSTPLMFIWWGEDFCKQMDTALSKYFLLQLAAVNTQSVDIAWSWVQGYGQTDLGFECARHRVVLCHSPLAHAAAALMLLPCTGRGVWRPQGAVQAAGQVGGCAPCSVLGARGSAHCSGGG